jgi:hypothetical protein
MKAKPSFFDKSFSQTLGKFDQRASQKKVLAIAITAMIVISVFAGVMLAMAQSATPEDAGTGNVVPGEAFTRE